MISMGLGGSLGAMSEVSSYRNQLEEIQSMIKEPEDAPKTLNLITKVFAPYNLPASTFNLVTTHFAELENLDEFLMTHHHCKKLEANRASKCGGFLAGGYGVGGFIPLFPYLFVSNIHVGLAFSFLLMAVALFSFGYVKTCAVQGWEGNNNLKAGLLGGGQMFFVGGFAAGSAMAFVYFCPKG